MLISDSSGGRAVPNRFRHAAIDIACCSSIVARASVSLEAKWKRLRLWRFPGG